MMTKETRITVARAAPLLAYWGPETIAAMVEATRHRRNGERNAAFIRAGYVGSLRVSEALSLTPGDVGRGPVLRLRVTKGKEPRPVAITQAVADALLAYARRRGLAEDDRLFPFSRFAARRIVQQAARDAGTWVQGARTHLLRHSGAIERLRQHGNPRALQLHLGHTRRAVGALIPVREPDSLHHAMYHATMSAPPMVSATQPARRWPPIRMCCRRSKPFNGRQSFVT